MSIFFAFLLFLLIFYIISPWKYPWITESDLSNKDTPWFQLYYANKYLRPVKRAARNSNLEEYFNNNSAPLYGEPLQDSSQLTINAVGDVMVRGEFSEGDSATIWDDCGKDLFSSDLTFGNMEFSVNENWLIDKTIRYSMTHKQADVMVEHPVHGKFDILTLANNHINDSLSQGIITTQEYLDKKGIVHFGANISHEDQDEFPVIEKNGIKVAFIGYTFTTNGIPLEDDFQFGTNHIRFNAKDEKIYDPGMIHRHIKIARERGADLIIASLHWGVEFEYYPPVRIVKRGHEILEAGVDIIIGHHPHILNPSEWYKTKDGRDTLCLYSLGSVTTTAMPWVVMNTAQIAGILLEKGINSKGETEVRIEDVTLTPTFFMRRGRGKTSSHRILPLLKTVEQLKKGEKPEYINMLQRFRLKLADREYRKFFIQKAFKYR